MRLILTRGVGNEKHAAAWESGDVTGIELAVARKLSRGSLAELGVVEIAHVVVEGNQSEPGFPIAKTWQPPVSDCNGVA